MAVDETRGETQLLDLTAALYLHAPDDRAIASRLHSSDSLIALMGDRTIQRLMARVVQVSPAALREEYDALFLVPVSGRYLLPFESAHRASRLNISITHDIASFYRAARFDLKRVDADPYWRTLAAPDHIGLELAFMSSLAQSQARAAAGKALELARIRDLFWREHLSRWAETYGEKLEQYAQTPLYQALGRLTMQVNERLAHSPR